MTGPLLSVKDLTITFPGKDTQVPVVEGLGFSLDAGEILALVGESGSGKSMTALAILRLLPKPGHICRSSIVKFAGRNLQDLSVPDMRGVRGDEIAMIFQEPMTSLNPVVPVGRQVAEAISLHETVSKQEARNRIIEAFEMVGIPDPQARLSAFPHQLSGGLKQRVMIAMAMVMRPQLLIADEPTTALDVTVQAQILALLRDLASAKKTAVLLITHDFGVVNEVADRVAVMYAGKIVEQGLRTDLLRSPQHPYTQGLLHSIPRQDARGNRLMEISGVVPRPGEWPPGCRFQTRCPHAFAPCHDVPPPQVDVTATQVAWCHALVNNQS